MSGSASEPADERAQRHRNEEREYRRSGFWLYAYDVQHILLYPFLAFFLKASPLTEAAHEATATRRRGHGIQVPLPS